VRLDLNTGKIVPPKLDLDALLASPESVQDGVATDNESVATNKNDVATNNPISVATDTVHVATRNQSVATNNPISVATRKQTVATRKQSVATDKRKTRTKTYAETVRFRDKAGVSEVLKQAALRLGFDDMSDLIRSAIRYALKDPNFKK
jgi:hypothetical protein